MPRNTSGVYTLPSGNPVVAGTIIESAWANITLADVASEITNSLDRSGRGSMLAAFKSMDGTLAQPGLTFGNEPSSGLYRGGSSDIRMGVAGTFVQQWTPTGVVFPLAATFTGMATFNGGTTIAGTAGYTGPVTITAAPNQLIIRSTGAGVATVLSLGRTTDEQFLATSAGVNGIVTGSIAGDAVWRVDGGGRLLFGQGIDLRALIDSTGYTGIGAVTARGSVPFQIVTSQTSIGVLSGFPSRQYVNSAGGANSKVWQEYATANTLTSRVVDDANSTAANWLEVVRSGASISSIAFPNGDVGVGMTPPNYGAGTRTMAVNSVGGGQPVYDLLIGGVRQAVWTVNPSFALLGTIVAKPIYFYTNNLQRMELTAGGDFGIGVTPTTKLDIFGTYALIRNGSFSLYWGSGSLVGGGGTQGCLRSDGDLLFGIGASEVGRFTATTFALSTPTGSFFIGGQRTVSSGTFALAINAAFNAGHGNSRAPDHMKVWLVCLTAEAGYAVGQRVEWIPNRTGFTGGYTAFADATNLSVYTFNTTIQLPNASTGVATNITPANWQVRMVGIWQ